MSVQMQFWRGKYPPALHFCLNEERTFCIKLAYTQPTSCQVLVVIVNLKYFLVTQKERSVKTFNRWKMNSLIAAADSDNVGSQKRRFECLTINIAPTMKETEDFVLVDHSDSVHVKMEEKQRIKIEIAGYVFVNLVDVDFDFGRVPILGVSKKKVN